MFDFTSEKLSSNADSKVLAVLEELEELEEIEELEELEELESLSVKIYTSGGIVNIFLLSDDFWAAAIC